MNTSNVNGKTYLAEKGKRYADICDRCGREIGRTIEQYPARWLSNTGCHYTNKIGLGVMTNRGKVHTLDLCDICAKELTYWMQRRKD